jgi:hypothetical protein
MYRIVITKEENVTATEAEWRKLWDSDAIPEGCEQYGNVETTVEKVKQTQLLDQRVEDLDMPVVITAINKLYEVQTHKLRKPEVNNGPANTTTQA